jgi:hypothetical protein
MDGPNLLQGRLGIEINSCLVSALRSYLEIFAGGLTVSCSDLEADCYWYHPLAAYNCIVLCFAERMICPSDLPTLRYFASHLFFPSIRSVPSSQE